MAKPFSEDKIDGYKFYNEKEDPTKIDEGIVHNSWEDPSDIVVNNRIITTAYVSEKKWSDITLLRSKVHVNSGVISISLTLGNYHESIVDIDHDFVVVTIDPIRTYKCLVNETSTNDTSSGSASTSTNDVSDANEVDFEDAIEDQWVSSDKITDVKKFNFSNEEASIQSYLDEMTSECKDDHQAKNKMHILVFKCSTPDTRRVALECFEKVGCPKNVSNYKEFSYIAGCLRPGSFFTGTADKHCVDFESFDQIFYMYEYDHKK